jgi:predicted ABC-type ATPase
MENREVYSALPAFFRTIGDVKLTADEIRRMIDQLIKGDPSAAKPETGDGRVEKRAIIVAGPNGAGKTIFIREYLNENDIPYISADAIAEQMSEGDIREVALAAGRKFFTDLYGAIESGKSFVVETTLSGQGFRRMLRRMKHERYVIDMIYIYLDSPEFCVTRIEERTRRGGHHVPEEDVIRRFHRSIGNFRETCRAEADSWYLIRNTAQQFVEVARGRVDERTVFEEQAYNTFLETEGSTDERRII